MGFNSGFKGLNTAQHVSGILMPIISLSTVVVASGLPLERGGSSVIGRGRSGISTTGNKSERLMHLVGWFIWIYDDARTYKP